MSLWGHGGKDKGGEGEEGKVKGKGVRESENECMGVAIKKESLAGVGQYKRVT